MERRTRRRQIVIFYYRLTLQYKGTNYSGWQIQPSERTIQGELNQALKVISKSEMVKTLGSGRTDSGVHALDQVVKAAIELQIDPQSLLKALNGNLPQDIRVVAADFSDEKFMPTSDAKSKEYHYRFTRGKYATALQNDFITNQPFELDQDKLQTACRLLVGKHDFVNYFCEGTEVNSTVREIFECDLLLMPENGFMPAHFMFKFVGSGFLKQMVRLLVGALWNVGRGKISLEEFKKSLNPPRGERLGAVAPPEGLYLARVNY
jgi:tRNA pseudouridine38-40 synthase